MKNNSMICALVILFPLILPVKVSAQGEPFARILDELDGISRVVGEASEEPEENLQTQLNLIREAVSPNLTRTNPRHVWVVPMNNDTWILGGETTRAPWTYFAAHNPSPEAQKVRLQGVFGGVVLIERDTEIPAGQSRELWSGPMSTVLVPRVIDGLPVPNTWVVSSNAKVIPQGLLYLLRTPVEANTENTGVNLDFTLLDCNDYAASGGTCPLPNSRVPWEVFVEGYEQGR